MAFGRRRSWGRNSRYSYGYGHYGYFDRHEKQPAPKDGVKATGKSRTWWGAQWIAALDRLGAGYSNRLPRGKAYAREGRVRDLELTCKGATARVVGTSRTPYTVTIRLGALTGPEWERLIEGLRAQARHITSLLAGRMPDALDPDVALLLFPRPGRDLTTDCSCPDYANPCKHVAAVHYVLAEALDRDPFLLFELRGKGRQAVLDSLGLGAPTTDGDPPAPSTAPGTSSAKARRRTAPAAQPDQPAMDWDTLVGKGAGMPDLHFHLAGPETDALILEQLGPVPGAGGPWVWETALTPTYRKVGETALSLGLGETGAAGTPPRSTPRTGRHAPSGQLSFLDAPRAPAPTPRDTGRARNEAQPDLEDRVTDLLRRSSALTINELALQLDVGREALRITLRRLLTAGAIVKKGNTRATRYGASLRRR